MPPKSKSAVAAPASNGDADLSLAHEEDLPVEHESARRLIVRARVDGFRRAGRSWPAAGCVVLAEAFSTEELDALLSEPMLIVVHAEGKVQ